MEECPTEAPCKEHMDQGYEGDSDEERSDSTPMIRAPQHLARRVHATHALIPQGAAHVASAGQTSAHPRMKVALCLEVNNTPPA